VSTVSYAPAFENQAPARPPAGIGVIVSWLLIAATVLFVSIRVWKQSRTEAAGQAADDVTLQMSARAAVGYHALFGGLEQDAQSRNAAQISQQVLASAHTPREKLRAVTVLGELEGGPAALDELDAISPSLGTVGLQQDAATLRAIYTGGTKSVSADRRQSLIDHHGWFARLALSFGLPPDDPGRSGILSSGKRAILASLGFEVLLLLLAAGGITFCTIAVVRLVDRRLKIAYRPPAYPAGAFLEAFALYLVGYVGIGWMLHRFYAGPTWLAYVIELAWVAFACCWPLIRGVSWSDLRHGLGWTRGRGVLREAGAGLLGYLASVPVLVLAVYVTLCLGKLSGERAVHPIVFGAGTGLKTILGLYLLASLWAPVVEETMFRGALFHHLRSRHRWLFSAAVSALIFASLHPQGWTAIPILGAIGFVFAGIREWRGTALASAAAHALNNAVATTMLILTLG
jgi:membrane protease YdiL (CAAX protease family)